MNKYEIIVGIDIGLNGGIAFFDPEETSPLYLRDMPTFEKENGKRGIDLQRLKFILETPKERGDGATAVMEDVHAFPGQGSVSVGTLLEQKGIILGMATALGYSVKLISPRTWQGYFGLVPPKGLKGSSASNTKTLRKKWLKEKSLEIARQKFPEYKEKLQKSTAHGLSDALLIGLWAKETAT